MPANFVDPAVTDYIIEAVRLVAREGWKLLPDYRFDPLTGLWHHRNGLVEPPLSLTDVSYADDGAMTYPHHTGTAPIEALQEYLTEARRILATAATTLGPAAHLSDDFDHLRWFTLPEACLG